ncbi:MAG TPA: ankyrin repeat domain-containing protein [Roseiarcus sp.]
MSAAALLRLAALASCALISAAGLSLARDRCADTAQAVQALHDDDRYQATTLLFAAARLGCETQARALLDRGAAIDAKDREGKTALAKASEADKLPLIRLFLKRGANVNARAVDGSTPLFYAAEQDRGAVVALLLERGADPNLAGRNGLRPLAAAAFNGSTESVGNLLKFGADPNALDNDGSAAIVYAAGHGYAAVVAALLQAGVDVNRRYAHGLTALMWAAGYDASTGVDDVDATITTLIAHGAALDLKDDRGKTAADIARDLGHDRAVKLLER